MRNSWERKSWESHEKVMKNFRKIDEKVMGKL